MSTSTPISLFELLERYLNFRLGVGKVAADSYRTVIRTFEKCLGREATIDDLNEDTINKYLRWMLDCGAAKETVASKRRVLLQFARFAVRRKLVAEMPDVPQITLPRRNPRAFLLDQMQRLLAACRKAQSLPAGNYGWKNKPDPKWTGADWEILIRLIWESGNRPSCLFSVPFRDLTADGWIRVQAENEKSGLEKLDQLSPELMELINRRRAERRASDDDKILPWPHCKRYMWFAFRRDVLVPAGLENENLSLYGILKSGTSHIAKEEGQLAAMMYRGHTNMDTTKRYLDPRIAANKKPSATILPKLDIEPPKDPDHHPE